MPPRNRRPFPGCSRATSPLMRLLLPSAIRRRTFANDTRPDACHCVTNELSNWCDRGGPKPTKQLVRAVVARPSTGQMSASALRAGLLVDVLKRDRFNGPDVRCDHCFQIDLGKLGATKRPRPMVCRASWICSGSISASRCRSSPPGRLRSRRARAARPARWSSISASCQRAPRRSRSRGRLPTSPSAPRGR